MNETHCCGRGLLPSLSTVSCRVAAMVAMDEEYLTARMGKMYMVPSNEVRVVARLLLRGAPGCFPMSSETNRLVHYGKMELLDYNMITRQYEKDFVC